MATHDYVIDNSTGANVRADLNLVLQAILSNNSSSSAPSTTAAYMWWADTTNGVLKIRNSANNAWVELLQLDGTLTLEDGTVSAPALAFRDDLNTGIYSSAADKFNIATGGVERMELGTSTVFNEDGADVDFRIEGDNQANLFHVDAGNDRIGFGTGTPSVFIHAITANTAVAKFESTATGASGAEIRLFHHSASPADNDDVGVITFSGTESAGGTETDYVALVGTAADVTDGTEDGEFTIDTKTAASLTEKFRLDADGIRLQNMGNGGGLAINQLTTTGNYGSVIFNSNRNGDFDVLGMLRGDWNSDSVAEIDLLAGNDTSNKDNGKIAFKTQANNSDGLQHRMLINEDGQVLIGGTTNANAPNTNEKFIVYGNANNNSRIVVVATHNDDNPSKLEVAKTRGSGNQILGDNDDVGALDFTGNDGAGFHVMARIMASSTGQGNSNDDLPCRLRFFTLDQNTTSVKEVMRLTQNQKLLVTTNSTDFSDQYSNNAAEFVNAHADSVVGVRSTQGASQQDYITFKFGGGPTSCGGIRRDGTTQGVELFSNSDKRIKTNILDMDNVLDKINQLALKKFDFKDGSGSGVGLIAQDLVSIFPSKVKKDDSDDGTGDTVPDGVDPWTVGNNFTYELLKAIQELTARVAALEAA